MYMRKTRKQGEVERKKKQAEKQEKEG